MLICVMKLKLYVLLRLCLNEVSVDVEHASVSEMMNEDVNMPIIQCYESNDLYERCAHMHTHLHIEWMNEWLKLKIVNEKGEF